MAISDIIDIVCGSEVSWLHCDLAACSRADLVRLLMTLGMFSVGWRGRRRVKSLRSAGSNRSGEIIIAGNRMLREWPVSLHSFLESQAGLKTVRPGRFGAKKTFGGFYDWLQASEQTRLREVIIDVVRHFTANNPSLGPGSHRSGMLRPPGTSPASKHITLTEAARVTGRSTESLHRMMGKGKIPAIQSHGRGVPIPFERAVAERLVIEKLITLTFGQVATQIGLSRDRARRLVQAGFITSIPGNPAEGESIERFSKEEVEQFLDRLTPTGPHTGLLVSFETATGMLRRRGIALDAFLSLIMSGDLPIRAVAPHLIGLKRLQFAINEIRHYLSGLLPPDTLSRQAASELLKLKWAVVANLVARDFLRADASGMLARKDIERFRAAFVTSAELARAQKTSSRSLVGRLAATGVRPIVGPSVDGSGQYLFDRAEVARVALG